jgi:hypothetical protein
LGGFCACDQELLQLQPTLILSDEFANVITARAVAALFDLLVDEILEGVRQGDVHCGHGEVLLCPLRIGKGAPREPSCLAVGKNSTTSVQVVLFLPSVLGTPEQSRSAMPSTAPGWT